MMARKKMDISPPATPIETFELRIPQRPLSPWLRLAHVAGQPQSRYVSHNANVRTIRDYELVLQLSGSTWIWSEPHGGSVDIEAGELAFIPPGYAHGWANEPGQHIAVHFDLHANLKLETRDNLKVTPKLVTRKPLNFMPSFSLKLPAGWDAGEVGGTLLTIPLVTRLRAPALWREKFEPLTLLYSRRAHHGFAAQLLTAETLGWALRTLLDDVRHAAGPSAATRESDAQILTLLRELETAPAGRPSISGLAQRVHMGLTAFRDAFHRVTGRSPRDYIEERRVDRAARRLIETDLAVLEIAETEGFDDPYHFSRVFKRVMKLSPREYRQKGRK